MPRISYFPTPSSLFEYKRPSLCSWCNVMFCRELLFWKAQASCFYNLASLTLLWFSSGLTQMIMMEGKTPSTEGEREGGGAFGWGGHPKLKWHHHLHQKGPPSPPLCSPMSISRDQEGHPHLQPQPRHTYLHTHARAHTHTHTHTQAHPHT